jgi:hypothetical protein
MNPMQRERRSLKSLEEILEPPLERPQLASLKDGILGKLTMNPLRTPASLKARRGSWSGTQTTVHTTATVFHRRALTGCLAPRLRTAAECDRWIPKAIAVS